MQDENINLNFDDKVIKLIAEKGYDPHFGARPIRRTIAELIENPLSDEILSGKFTHDDIVNIEAVKDKISFKKTNSCTFQNSFRGSKKEVKFVSYAEQINHETYSVHHNPNCPRPFQVRLIGNRSAILDNKPRGSQAISSDMARL